MDSNFGQDKSQKQRNDLMALYSNAENKIIKARQDKFEAIKGLMLMGYTYTQIGKFFNVSEQHISFYYRRHSKNNPSPTNKG